MATEAEIRNYLSELVNQLSTREAAVALGYSASSFTSLKSLLDAYGVEIPTRRNQYEALGVENGPQPILSHKVSVRSAHRVSVGIERCFVFGDTHGTQVDTRSFSVMLSVLGDVKPEYGIINGDFIDFESISRFSKDPRQRLQLQEEIDNANYLLDKLQGASPDTEWVYVEGNHEVRLREFLRRNAEELVGLHRRDEQSPLLSVPYLLELERRGIAYVEQVGKSGYTQYGPITVGHFDKYSSVPGSVARWFMEHRNESVIQAHTHKCAELYRRFPDGREIVCIEHGHMMTPNPDYVTDPDWCQGFVIITKRVDTDRFHAELIRVVDHECLFGEVLYSG